MRGNDFEENKVSWDEEISIPETRPIRKSYIHFPPNIYFFGCWSQFPLHFQVVDAGSEINISLILMMQAIT